MINKRFSLYEAYSFGVQTVINNFSFFLATMFFGSVASLIFLSVLGYVDYMMFKEHFESLVKICSHAMSEPTGALHVGDMTVHARMQEWLPYALSKHAIPRDVVSVDITRQDVMNALSFLLPVGVAFKCFLNVLSVGWTKMALDLQANKEVSFDYIYKFYYHVPAVIIVELIILAITILGLMLAIFPGVIVYERLRFARYFIIDKNQSVFKALGSSWNLTDGSVIHLTGYSIFSNLLRAFGHMFFIATFFMTPLSYQVEANVYRQLTK